MGTAHPAFAIAVLLFLFAGVALVLFDRRTKRAHTWVSASAVVALGLSLLALILAVCSAIFYPDWGATESRTCADRVMHWSLDSQ